MNYRDILYADYSASFGQSKRFEPQVQFGVYAGTYPPPACAKDAEILDVGCGKGEWLAWLKQQGFTRLSGVDVSPSDMAQSQTWLEGVTLVQDRTEAFLEGKAEAFDLIHGKDVVEHMTKDEFIAFLQLARAALRPGGQLWLLTFNAQAPLAGAVRYGDFTHEIGLTPSSMAQCLRACGFGSVSVRGTHYCSKSLSGRSRWLLSQPVHCLARLMLRLRHGGGGMEGGVDALSPLPDMLAVATKPCTAKLPVPPLS